MKVTPTALGTIIVWIVSSTTAIRQTHAGARKHPPDGRLLLDKETPATEFCEMECREMAWKRKNCLRECTLFRTPDRNGNSNSKSSSIHPPPTPETALCKAACTPKRAEIEECSTKCNSSSSSSTSTVARAAQSDSEDEDDFASSSTLVSAEGRERTGGGGGGGTMMMMMSETDEDDEGESYSASDESDTESWTYESESDTASDEIDMTSDEEGQGRGRGYEAVAVVAADRLEETEDYEGTRRRHGRRQRERQMQQISVDSCSPIGFTYNAVNCAIQQSLDSMYNECQWNAASSMNPNDPTSAESDCTTTQNWAMYCQTMYGKQTAQLDGSGSVVSECSQVPITMKTNPPLIMPKTMNVRTNLDGWEVDLEVKKFTSTSSSPSYCSMRFNKETCEDCSVCQHSSGMMGISADCGSQGVRRNLSSDGSMVMEYSATGGMEATSTTTTTMTMATEAEDPTDVTTSQTPTWTNNECQSLAKVLTGSE